MLVQSNPTFVQLLLLVILAIVGGLTFLVLRNKPDTRRAYQFGDEFVLPRRLSSINMLFGPLAIIPTFKANEAVELLALAAALLFYFAGLLAMRYFHPSLLFKRSPVLYLNYASVLVGVFLILLNHHSVVHSFAEISLRHPESFLIYLPVLAVGISAFALYSIKVAPQE